MLRRLLIAGLLMLPTTLSAQFLQNVSTADYSLRTVLTKQSDFTYLYQVQFRNESAFDPSRVFAITDVTVTGVSGNLPFGGRQETNLGTAFLGNVYTGPLSTSLPGKETLQFVSHWFNISTPGLVSQRFGGSPSSGDASAGWGLLGCGIPVLPLGNPGAFHSGNTCASAGYTGWATLNLQLNFFDATPNYAGDDISASVLGFAFDRPAVSVVPEPSAFAMIALGLAGIAWRARRRTRHS